MPTLHLVPHTHWDREWYQPFQVFRAKLVHLMDRLLQILEQCPAYRYFTLDGQTIILEDYLDIRPQRESEIKKLIGDGRLLIGPWYVMPDEFLVSPEAIVRNLLKGTAMGKHFGARMDVGYLPDPFGHLSQMPQILRGFGLESAMFRRGLSDEPCEVWWQAPDGSRVLTAYLRDGYDNAAHLPPTSEAFAARLRSLAESLLPHSAIPHILLMNGADHQEPLATIPALIAAAADEGTPVVHSSVLAYMEAVQQYVRSNRPSLPVVSGELRHPKRHHLLPGVLSSRTRIKLRNHACETLLERWVEPFSAWSQTISPDGDLQMAWTANTTTPRIREPKALLDEAWRILLQCQPHDSICGCSIDQVHEEMLGRFDQAEQIGEEIARQSLSALAQAADTAPLAKTGAQHCLVVFNPGPSARSGRATAALELPAGLDPFEIVDERGATVPYRVLERQSQALADMELDAEGLGAMFSMVETGRVMGLSFLLGTVARQSDHAQVEVVLSEDREPNFAALEQSMGEVNDLLADQTLDRFRLVAHLPTLATIELLAPDVPGNGYRTFGLRPIPVEPNEVRETPGLCIENQWLRAAVNDQGYLSLTDKRLGIEFPRLLSFRDTADRGDSYTFCPLDEDEPITAPSEPPRVRRLEDPCGQALEVKLLYRLPEGLADDRASRSSTQVDCPVTVVARLAPGVPRLDLRISLENNARDHRLQVCFPLPYAVDEGEYDGHFDVLSRPTSPEIGGPDWAEQPCQEKPMRSFVAARRGKDGLMVASRGLREASVFPEGEIRVTLLRCFGWLSRDDLATRKGGAGPKVPTPGGQSPGRHTYHLSLIPFQGNLLQARLQAEAFQTEMRGVGTGLHTGLLPAAVSLLAVQPECFAITAVKSAEDGPGIIIRGVNLSQQQQDVRLQTALPMRSAAVARMDEESIRDVPLTDANTVTASVRPKEILTLRLTLGQITDE